MSQVMPLPSRSGWNPEETAQLWQEVRACNSSGQPLRAAFERMAARTGRKSNSIRRQGGRCARRRIDRPRAALYPLFFR